MDELKQSYRVVLIEPSPIIQTGLKAILDSLPDFTVVGTLADMSYFTERMATMRAGIVIINPGVVEYHRRNMIRLQFQSMPDVLLIGLIYSYIDSEVLKQFHGIIDILDDRAKMERKLKTALKSSQIEPESEGYDLSEREKEILVAVAKGMINKEIASHLNISIHTVISHRKNISRKTGIKSVSGLTVYALLNNLIEQNEIQ